MLRIDVWDGECCWLAVSSEVVALFVSPCDEQRLRPEPEPEPAMQWGWAWEPAWVPSNLIGWLGWPHSDWSDANCSGQDKSAILTPDSRLSRKDEKTGISVECWEGLAREEEGQWTLERTLENNSANTYRSDQGKYKITWVKPITSIWYIMNLRQLRRYNW